MYKRFLLTVVFSFMIFGCSSIERSKEFMSENNPLKEASRKENLAQAREDVKESKKAYFKCMDENDQDVYECVPEREKYDSDTERYIQLQQSEN